MIVVSIVLTIKDDASVIKINKKCYKNLVVQSTIELLVYAYYCKSGYLHVVEIYTGYGVSFNPRKISLCVW